MYYSLTPKYVSRKKCFWFCDSKTLNSKWQFTVSKISAPSDRGQRLVCVTLALVSPWALFTSRVKRAAAVAVSLPVSYYWLLLDCIWASSINLMTMETAEQCQEARARVRTKVNLDLTSWSLKESWGQVCSPAHTHLLSTACAVMQCRVSGRNEESGVWGPRVRGPRIFHSLKGCFGGIMWLPQWSQGHAPRCHVVRAAHLCPVLQQLLPAVKQAPSPGQSLLHFPEHTQTPPRVNVRATDTH